MELFADWCSGAWPSAWRCTSGQESESEAPGSLQELAMDTCSASFLTGVSTTSHSETLPAHPRRPQARCQRSPLATSRTHPPRASGWPARASWDLSSSGEA
eukprot:7228839-Alexandrium_andersonii.AAC.1